MFLKLLVASLLLLSLGGCGASKYSIPSQKVQKDIITNKEMSYMIFGVEEISISRAEPIFEYFPETETFRLVTIMGSHQKYIYEMPEGVHYFYSMGGETYDFLKVEAQKGKKYYSSIDTVFWTFRMTTPIVFNPTTDPDLIEDINKKTLVENSKRSQLWYEKRKNNQEFKAAVKERFLEWKEDDMKEKTLNKEDGFKI